jgi:hypothetical protein
MWFALREDPLSLGAMRAVLIVAHGVVELFFPYFDIVGHETDTALVDLLAEITPADVDERGLMEDRLRRFASAMHDGHAFVYDYETPAPSGVIAARFEARDGYPVVRRTGLVSAASDGFRHHLVTRMLTAIDDPIELTIESSEGAVQTVLLDPESDAADEALGPAPIDRATGWLDDVGAPTVQYINMSNTSDESLFAAIDDAIAGSATGMIVDMRGYPSGDHYAVVQRLIPGPFESPHFEIPVRTGPDALEVDASFYPLAGVDAYAGPMVLLVGNHAVSAAENFSIMLVGADRATVVGQQSAATNGNISGIMLPSGYMLAFTSMRVLYPDGSTFHGVGIVPDVEVPFDPVAYAQGEDPELTAALAELQP